MKNITTAILAAFLMCAIPLFAATNDITALLQKGLFEEEANHNLDAALRQYQAAVDGYDQDRQLAATAVFRLGECYRKLGKTNEAAVQYQRVLREFPDQTALATLSREYLAGKTPTVAANEPGATAVTAAEDEEVRKIREMIRNSPDLINAPANGGDTPLQSSVKSGNIAAAELLLANGANVNGTATTLRTPLGLAADTGNKAMIELLLAKGADVNGSDKNNASGTPLHYAVIKGFKTAAEVLIAHKADVNARRQGGVTPLHDACAAGFSALAELLISSGAEVNASAANGDTPLFRAVSADRAEMVQLLLSHKAEVNFTNSAGETPLFMARQNQQADVARLLLEGGAYPNHRSRNGFTPLLNAAENNQTEIVRVLLSDKADVNAATPDGITPLLYAIGKRDDIALVKILLDNGANTQAVKTGDSIGMGYFTPSQSLGQVYITLYPGMYALNLAMSVGRTDVMEALLAAHADPNARFSCNLGNGNDFDVTPLFWVFHCTSQQADETKILLEHGANPDLTDDKGRTPLSVAVSDDRFDLVQLLLDHHADPNKADNDGDPPLRYLSPIGGGYADQIRTALLKAGANEDYQRMAGIYIAQSGTGSYGQEVFYKGTNTVNHYSLLEAVAMTCQSGHFSPVKVPDFAHAVINRVKAGGGKQEIPINLEDILASGDCSKDVPLEWGDVVQVPEKDHLLNEGFEPLPNSYGDTLRKCLERHVEIVIKGQSTKLTLLPIIPYNQGQAVAAHGTTLYTFWLDEVIREANVLLLSSDLSRVKVVRHGTELSFDLEQRSGRGGAVPGMPGRARAVGFGRGARGGGGGGGGGGGFVNQPPSANDLWLRDGDVIEIPERDPNAPVAK